MGWAACAQAEEGWFHLYIFKPHNFKTSLIAEEVVVCMLEQEMFLNLGHIDMNFEVLYVVNVTESVGSRSVTILCARHSVLFDRLSSCI